MQVLWTSHCRTPEEKKNFEDMVHSSSKVIGRIKDILSHKLNSVSSTDEQDFDSPSWAQKMAYNLGQRKVLDDLIQLLTI